MVKWLPMWPVMRGNAIGVANREGMLMCVGASKQVSKLMG